MTTPPCIKNDHIRYACICIVFSFILCLQISSYGQPNDKLDISLYNSYSLKTLLITPVAGEYGIFDGDSLISNFRKDDMVYFTADNDRIRIRFSDKIVNGCKNISIRGRMTGNEIKVKPVIPGLDPRRFEDDLKIVISGGNLVLINKVDIEKYIAGVVEAEGGPKSPVEYYKAQAILCRTYAYKHLRRHVKEGFHLCDEVHCQAYHGMSKKNPEIQYAVFETRGLVLTDQTNTIITAVYHSNCGGETVSAENVWINPLPYLFPVKEEYCLQGPHASWEKAINTTSWKDYLRNMGLPYTDTLHEEFFRFDQETRKLYYLIMGDSLALRQIRSDWGLKSTFFNVIPTEGAIFFDGKGYGHGVGMCQEGAIGMARKGKEYREIINQYFKNVKIARVTDVKGIQR
jgi:stage II sporulation protein D